MLIVSDFRHNFCVDWLWTFLIWFGLCSSFTGLSASTLGLTWERIWIWTICTWAIYAYLHSKRLCIFGLKGAIQICYYYYYYYYYYKAVLHISFIVLLLPLLHWRHYVFAARRGLRVPTSVGPVPNVQGVSIKSSRPKTFWNIFTAVKSFFVKFYKFVGNSYPRIPISFCRFILIFH